MAGRMAPEARREALVDAAASTFRAQDYAATAVADVAAAAGVSEPLVFRYFPTKAALHAAVLRRWSAELSAREDAALATLPDGAHRREQVRVWLDVLLDDAASGSRWWIEPHGFPPESVEVVDDWRRSAAERLRALLPEHWTRHTYAVRAWPGFVEAGVRTWLSRGYPDDERRHLVEAALGALEGALGDWAG